MYYAYICMHIYGQIGTYEIRTNMYVRIGTYVCILVHKQMFYIRMNLRMLQHSNVECNIRMFILCNSMVYFGDFVVLVAYISSGFIFITY